MAVPGRVMLLKNDAQATSVGKIDTFAQASRAAQAIQHTRDAAGVLAEFGRLAFEAVYFLDDFDGQKNFMFIEAEERLGVVKEDVGIKNVIFFHAREI